MNLSISLQKGEVLGSIRKWDKYAIRNLIIEVMSECSHSMSAWEVYRACREKSPLFKNRIANHRSLVQYMKVVVQKAEVVYVGNLVITKYVLRKEFKPKR